MTSPGGWCASLMGLPSFCVRPAWKLDTNQEERGYFPLGSLTLPKKKAEPLLLDEIRELCTGDATIKVNGALIGSPLIVVLWLLVN